MKISIIKKIGLVVGMALLLGMIQACYFPFHHHWYDNPTHHGHDGSHHGHGHYR